MLGRFVDRGIRGCCFVMVDQCHLLLVIFNMEREYQHMLVRCWNVYGV